MNTLRWLGITLVALAACSDDGGGGGTAGSATTSTGNNAGGGASTTTTTTTTGPGSGGSGGAGGAATADTWANYAQGFFTTYCVECHGTSDTAGNVFTTLAGVQVDAALIRCGVAPIVESGCTANDPAPRQFPISDATGMNPKPTDAERTRIVAWIDAGLPP